MYIDTLIGRMKREFMHRIIKLPLLYRITLGVLIFHVYCNIEYTRRSTAAMNNGYDKASATLLRSL